MCKIVVIIYNFYFFLSHKGGSVTVADIRWYKFSFPELLVINRPNKESLRLLTALLDNASFEGHVREFREENCVPEHGFDSNLHKLHIKE